MPRGYSRILDQKVKCLVTTDLIHLYLFEPIFYLLASLIFSPHNFNHLLLPNPKTKTYQHSM